jgi:hypothetical protein
LSFAQTLFVYASEIELILTANNLFMTAEINNLCAALLESKVGGCFGGNDCKVKLKDVMLCCLLFYARIA